MRIAYLILAHKNVAQLALLIDLLCYDNQNYCFIHLDKRIGSLSVKKELNKFTKSKNWQLIKKRMIINWGGFNMVEATLNLIVEASNFGSIKFDYFSLHSGMDLPIKNNLEIQRYLELHEGKQFMEFFELPNHENWGGNGGLDRLNYYWFVDEIGYLDSKKLVAAQQAAKLEKKRLKICGSIYGGSQWWTLTSDCAKYIIHFLNDTSGFYHFFKYSNIPDEMFFQTILLNSEYKESIVNNNLRFIDWKTKLKSPKTFNINDLKGLEQSEKLYARKFDNEVDPQIINQVLRVITKFRIY